MKGHRIRLGKGGLPALHRMAIASLYRWLLRRGRGLLATGSPPMAVYAHDTVGLQVTLHGRYEQAELDAVADLLRQIEKRAPGMVVDVGANIGNHSLFFARQHPVVWAFEPHPRTFRLLSLNAELAPHIRTFPLGLSDTEGEAWIDLPQGNAGMATVSDRAAAGRVKCQLSTLDAQMALHAPQQPVRLIKIDVEGHEARVLAGASGTLRRDQPIVLLEQAAHEFQDGTTPALDQLRALGYPVFVTLHAWPSCESRWLNLLLRLVRGEGFEFLWQQRLPATFHSMIVAVPESLVPARYRAGA